MNKSSHWEAVSTRSRPKAAGSAWVCRQVPTRFQHAAARRRLAKSNCSYPQNGCFNTQPPEGGWDVLNAICRGDIVSTRSRPKAAGEEQEEADKEEAVSTRSRPKAAGRKQNRQRHASYRFNTQPPEGGWPVHNQIDEYRLKFQHAAARRRLGPRPLGRMLADAVSTRSRPKAAGCAAGTTLSVMIRFNTQPPEGGWRITGIGYLIPHSFNTQPPEGGWHNCAENPHETFVSTRSRPKAAGRRLLGVSEVSKVSTRSRPKAAGRGFIGGCRPTEVSTRSRPKAAGRPPCSTETVSECFNTQPPEGGWASFLIIKKGKNMFQHAAARRRLGCLPFSYTRT